MMDFLGHDKSIHSILLVGDYGSGKTEVSVNLSMHWAAANPSATVAIADLDLVNPYFRCREAREPLERAGIKVIMPQGAHQYADLPILMPEIKGLIQNEGVLAVLDVGGDAVGSRVLAALAPVARNEELAFWFVVNGNRPFCDTLAGCLKSIQGIEEASGLKITGLVGNTHLMGETTAQMVLEGQSLTEEVAAALQVPIYLVAVMESVARQLSPDSIHHPLMTMGRLMVPPWLRREDPKFGPDQFKPPRQQ